MKSPLDKIYYLNNDPYPTAIALTFSRLGWVELMRRCGHVDADSPGEGVVQFFVSGDGAGRVSIFLDPSVNEALFLSNVCHEAVHVCRAVLKHIGEEGSCRGIEQEAYLTQHIFTQIFEIYAKKIRNTTELKTLRRQAEKAAKYGKGRTWEIGWSAGSSH